MADLLPAFGALLGTVFPVRRRKLVRGAAASAAGLGVAGAALLRFGVVGAIGSLFGAELGARAHRLATRLPIAFVALKARWAASPLGSLVLSNGQAAGGWG